MAKEKLTNRNPSSEELLYYAHLSFLFERVAWVTILWALVLNLLSPASPDVKDYTFLLIIIAAVFNISYFRYFYRYLRKKNYRFYIAEVIFPLLVWVFITLHPEFLSYFLLPYFILILATSLTLRRKDVALALGAALFFVILENIVLRLPLDSLERTTGIGQLASLLVYTWVVLKLTNLVKDQRAETGTVREEILNEEKKSTILKEYASELVLDRQKAHVLLEQYPEPLLLLDNKNHLIEINDRFKNFSDFKDERLVGKDLGYVLKLGTPINFDQKSYVPEDFDGIIITRRNKEKKVRGRAHFLLGRDQRLKQVLILFSSNNTS